jgi:hypothetical protein
MTTDEGDAISNDGTLTVTHSTFSNNYTGGLYGGAAITSGGTLAAGGTLTVKNSTFTGNNAFDGGAIASFGTRSPPCPGPAACCRRLRPNKRRLSCYMGAT